MGAYGGRKDIMQTVAPAGPMYQVHQLSCPLARGHRHALSRLWPVWADCHVAAPMGSLLLVLCRPDIRFHGATASCERDCVCAAAIGGRPNACVHLACIGCQHRQLLPCSLVDGSASLAGAAASWRLHL